MGIGGNHLTSAGHNRSDSGAYDGTTTPSTIRRHGPDNGGRRTTHQPRQRGGERDLGAEPHNTVTASRLERRELADGDGYADSGNTDGNGRLDFRHQHNIVISTSDKERVVGRMATGKQPHSHQDGVDSQRTRRDLPALQEEWILVLDKPLGEGLSQGHQSSACVHEERAVLQAQPRQEEKGGRTSQGQQGQTLHPRLDHQPR